MGIVNVTPDSFSDGGRFANHDIAVKQGLALFEAGADIVDVGGESTRPGAARVPASEEMRRVVPVVESLRKRGAGYISVDTSKAEVARAALASGADLVNDISAFTFDPEMPAVVREAGAPAVVMHLRGAFESMHQKLRYDDVVGEVVAELEESLRRAEEAGIAREQLIVDPGIGFSKTAEQSLEVLGRLPELTRLDRPVLLGPSRKSFMAGLLSGDRPVQDRMMGTAGAVAACVLAGVHVVRVHDVAAMTDIVRVCDAIREAG